MEYNKDSGGPGDIESQPEVPCSIMTWFNADSTRKLALEYICRDLSWEQYVDEAPGIIQGSNDPHRRICSKDEYALMHNLFNFSIYLANERAYANDDPNNPTSLKGLFDKFGRSDNG